MDVSEPDERRWPLPLDDSGPEEYGDERTMGDEAVRRREGMTNRLTQLRRGRTQKLDIQPKSLLYFVTKDL